MRKTYYASANYVYAVERTAGPAGPPFSELSAHGSPSRSCDECGGLVLPAPSASSVGTHVSASYSHFSQVLASDPVVRFT